MGGGREYALVLPGSASSVDFVVRAFAPVLGTASIVAVPTDSGDAAAIAADLARERRHVPAGARVLVVGVSLGAHAAALWAADLSGSSTGGPGADRLVLALPAWTGTPDKVAALSAAAADQVLAHGLDHHLRRLAEQFPDDWVAQEVTAAWRGRRTSDVARTLRATSASTAPTIAGLRDIRVPTTVVALAGDPMHPEEVARTWAASIPHARLAVVGRDDPGTDVAVLGRAVIAASEGP